MKPQDIQASVRELVILVRVRSLEYLIGMLWDQDLPLSYQICSYPHHSCCKDCGRDLGQVFSEKMCQITENWPEKTRRPVFGQLDTNTIICGLIHPEEIKIGEAVMTPTAGKMPANARLYRSKLPKPFHISSFIII
jgi:hypothetical protein